MTEEEFVKLEYELKAILCKYELACDERCISFPESIDDFLYEMGGS